MASFPNAGEWKSLEPKLSNEMLQRIEEMGFMQMTPVQASTIPLFLKNKDVVVEAITGSGKSLAFLIPLIEILKRRSKKLLSNQVGGIVITPTRELAVQLSKICEFLLKGEYLKMQLFIGGTDLNLDLCRFRELGGNIIISTPGRLEDLICKLGNEISMKELDILVLDEADRLLDMGFEKSITNIISKLPKQRRTGLFSATMNDALNNLVKAGLRNPVKIVIKVLDSQRTPENLEISYVLIEPKLKLNYLLKFLLKHRKEKVIVYFATCFCVDYFYAVLSKRKDIELFSLHGKMIHKKRTMVFQEFSDKTSGALFCTDLAARGLDIPDVDWVIQFDAPQDPSAFVHRVGRTARLGKFGKALILLQPNEEAYVDFLSIHEFTDLNESNSNDESMRLGESTSGSGDSLLSQVKEEVKKDRSLYEKSVKAFVSYMRSYQEHHANYIFRFKDLDFSSIMELFCLLRIPKMPELQALRIQYKPDKIDVSTIPFKDKLREKQRIEKNEKRKLFLEENPIKKKPKVQPWSLQKDKKQKKVIKSEKKQKKKDQPVEVSDNEDWNEFKKEKKLAKKLNQGKISLDDYKEAIESE